MQKNWRRVHLVHLVHRVLGIALCRNEPGTPHGGHQTSIGILMPMVARCWESRLTRCVDSLTIMKPSSGVAKSLG